MIYKNQDGSIYKIKLGLKPVDTFGMRALTAEEISEIEEVLNYLITHKANDKFS